MATNAVIVHQLPGRVRLRLHEKRGDPDYFSAMSENIARLNGVHHVKVNPSTGSMLIEFSESTDNLLRQLQQHDLYLSEKEHDHTNNMSERPTRLMSDEDAEPFHLVSNRDINPMFMVATMLAALGVVQTLRGKILVPSLSVFWYAMDAFRQSRTSRISTDSAKGH